MYKVYKLPAFVLFTASLLILSGCKKAAEIPTLITTAVSQITETTALTGGMVYSIGDAEVTSRGVCWGPVRNPTPDKFKTFNGTGSGAFISNINGLISNTTYYVRAYASSSAGTAYGDEYSFTTGIYLPASVSTSKIGSFGLTYAVASGNIISNGGARVTDWGMCWSTAEAPTTNDSRWSITGSMEDVKFTTVISGLSPGTTYYVRAYAVTIAAVSYGEERIFTTRVREEPISFNNVQIYGSVTDIDGNHYKTIQTGNQTWMAENLRTTRLNDGEPIAMVADNAAWSALATPGYCWYNNDPVVNKEIYGALYNWYAVNSGKLCPSGWHSPDSNDFIDLYKSVNNGEDGGKLKEEGVLHWAYPNSGASNENGWTALPGGVRGADGTFNGLGFLGSWWYNLDPLPTANGRFAILDNSSNVLGFTGLKSISAGISVRCVMNN